jgi:hypothetical protein
MPNWNLTRGDSHHTTQVNSKKLINSLLSLIVVLSLAWSIQSQDKANTVTTFKNPLEVKLKVNRRDYNRNGVGGDFAVENFYPVGWSKDGKFAYYVEPVDEACGCYFGKLVIIDLKNDAVVWQFDYTSDDPAEGESKKPKSLAALWNANRKLFSGKLKENNIEPHRPARVLSFPLSYKTDSVTPNLNVERKPMSEEDRVYGDISHVRVQLNSQQNGKKTVLDREFSEAKPLYVGIAGYLKSPLEPRVAIILIEIYRGYEGPPHVGGVTIVGASLEWSQYRKQ